jgi:hypothetical protein
MATLEEIIKEVRDLSTDDQRRLREVLKDLSIGDGDDAPYRTHYDERAWIDAHRQEYMGQWVALDGNHMVAHGKDARTVYDDARAQGVAAPYVERVGPKQENFIGGWQ